MGLVLVGAALSGQGALRFDGVNDYVTFGTAPGLGTTNFTIECWFKRQGAGVVASTGSGGFSALPLVTKGRGENEAGVTNMNYFFGLTATNTLAADFEDKNTGLNHPTTNTTAAASNVWQHAAVTYLRNGTNGTWVLYLNGAAIRTNTISGTNTTVTTPQGSSIQHAALGSALTTVGTSEGYFNGSLEEVRIWNTNRTASQIAANRDLRITSAPGLIGRWPLTEVGVTTIASDTSGSGINGTLLNGPVWTTDSPFALTGTAGIIGNTNDGVLTDGLWSGGDFINACRFQAGSNMTVSTMFAKVTAITGKYKCAIYSESNSLPNKLLRFTAEVTNPGLGWQTFPLTAPQSLTSGSNYWLAIWSDADNAQVYYTDSTGTLRWALTNYATAWPDPIVTTGGSNPKYCIYAVGDAAPPTLTITTTSLPDGVTNVPYSATLTATGGTTPYTWSLASGSLPSGLTLNTNNGAISGTPTVLGNFGFTARVRDNVGASNTSVALNINITSGLPPGTNVVFAFSNTWRYMQTSNLDGTTWKQPGYNDSAWPSGQGVLALEDCDCLPQPIRTTLTLFTNRLTHYFRTHFNFAGSTNGASLILSNLIDNGAVIYLNGTEIQRIRMPAGTITDSTPATEGVGNATSYDVVTVSGSLLTNLVQGDNVLAVEIHQADYESSDVVFGSSLTVISGGVAPSGSGGLSFDGVNDMVTFGVAPSLGVTNFTIECWFKPQGTSKRADTGTGGMFAVPLVTKGMAEIEAGATNMNYFFGIGTNNSGVPVLAADFEDYNNGLNHPIRGANAVGSNVWVHGAVTYDVASSNWVLYLNGVRDYSTNISGTGLVLVPRYDSIQHAALGSSLRTGGTTNASSGFFAGTMDEVRIWNYARSDAQILTNHNRQITNAAGLIARWSLDDATGTVATNSISGGVNGTLANGPVWAAGYPFPVTPNTPPALPAVVGPTNTASNVNTNATLTVTVSDPEASNLTVTFYGRAVNGAPAPGPDFTLVALPDTQHYSAGINGGIPDMFTNQTQWIVNNRNARNIQYLAQLGDCVQNGDNSGNDSQWRVATNSLYRLENPITTQLPEGLPYGIAVGNHDQGPTGNGDPNGTTTFYNQYFGESHFQGYNYYGDNYGANNDNHYDLFSASGLDFIVLYFEYDASLTTNSPVIAWANSVLATNQHRRAIVVSHHIINSGFNATFSSQGQAMYDGLKGNTNLFLMLSGHVSPEEGQRTNVFQGRTVWSVMTDYQGRSGGGNGWLRMYEFSPSNNVIRATTYSPWLSQSETDADSQFTIPYFMTTGNPFTVIGSANVASGENASIVWSNRAPGVQYEWYATVTDGSTTTTGPTSSFTTGSGAPQPPVITDEPNSQTVQCGDNAEMLVGVSSATTPSYQWYFGTTLLTDRTNATLALTSVGEANEGSYTVIVQNNAGSVTSAPAVLTIIDTNPPIVSSYTTNVTINANVGCQAMIPNLAASVVASDSCGGVTVTQLPLAGSVVGIGAYPVILTISDAANNQVTRNATVNVVETSVPVIAPHPQSTTNVVGTTATFTVSATSCSAISYQWLFGTNILVGKISPTLTITNVQPAHAGDYKVILGNAVGNSTSTVAVLTVLLPTAPVLSAGPSILPNGHFSVGFNGTPGVPYTILFAPEIIGPWQPLTNLIAAPNGYIGVEDFTVPIPIKRYYRAVYP